MTIRPAVRQAGMGEKDLRFWSVRLIVFQDGINDVAHFSGDSSNTCQMMFAFWIGLMT